MSQLDKSNNLDLVKEISLYIEESKQQLAITVNATLSLLYWQIGKRINEEILQNQRAEYGKEIVASLAQALSLEFGKGWSEKHLRQCLRTAETFQSKEIFYELSRELSWTHIRSVIYIEDDLKRDFYIEMCKLEKWSTRRLQERIQSMLFERTAISKKPEQTIKNDLALLNKEQKVSADLVFKDPYVLDFLGLKDAYSEKYFA